LNKGKGRVKVKGEREKDKKLMLVLGTGCLEDQKIKKTGVRRQEKKRTG
jgi:hypothetical protein